MKECFLFVCSPHELSMNVLTTCSLSGNSFGEEGFLLGEGAEAGSVLDKAVFQSALLAVAEASAGEVKAGSGGAESVCFAHVLVSGPVFVLLLQLGRPLREVDALSLSWLEGVNAILVLDLSHFYSDRLFILL